MEWLSELVPLNRPQAILQLFDALDGFPHTSPTVTLPLLTEYTIAVCVLVLIKSPGSN